MPFKGSLRVFCAYRLHGHRLLGASRFRSACVGQAMAVRQ